MTDIKESPTTEEERTSRRVYPDERNGKINIVFAEEKSVRERIAEKTNIMLPNVKELTKKFSKGIEEFSQRPSPTHSSVTNFTANGSSEFKNENVAEEEDENSIGDPMDSQVEIARNNLTVNMDKLLRHSSASYLNSDEMPTEETVKRATDIVDTLENAENGDKITEEKAERREIMKSSYSLPNSKFGGKGVHSLTARSISKEFREELKNNSSRRVLPKANRGSSAESDQVEIVSESVRNRSPTPPIDLQSKKKFWEDIISNSKK